jgi:hypothetical protein
VLIDYFIYDLEREMLIETARRFNTMEMEIGPSDVSTILRSRLIDQICAAPRTLGYLEGVLIAKFILVEQEFSDQFDGVGFQVRSVLPPYP